jgi:flagellin-like protein
MKKIWAMRKDREGVSPVIATILMVAITVVLAAVLYVMVLGFNTSVTTPIVVSFDKSSSATNWTLSVLSIAGTTQLATVDCLLLVKTAAGAVGMTQRAVSAMSTGIYYSGVRFTETGTVGGYLNAGDYLTLTRATYDQGSIVSLTSADGKTTYASVTI